MTFSTRLYCLLQQLCVVLLILGPFWAVSTIWISSHGPIPTWHSLWDIFYFTTMFGGLLMLVDNLCTALYYAFLNDE